MKDLWKTNNLTGLYNKKKQDSPILPFPSASSNKFLPSRMNDIGYLFKGKGHPNPLDKKTPQQKRFLNRTRPFSKTAHHRFIDYDGDGVISGLDCSPFNKNKHGLISWVKKKFTPAPEEVERWDEQKETERMTREQERINREKLDRELRKQQDEEQREAIEKQKETMNVYEEQRRQEFDKRETALRAKKGDIRYDELPPEYQKEFQEEQRKAKKKEDEFDERVSSEINRTQVHIAEKEKQAEELRKNIENLAKNRENEYKRITKEKEAKLSKLKTDKGIEELNKKMGLTPKEYLTPDELRRNIEKRAREDELSLKRREAAYRANEVKRLKEAERLKKELERKATLGKERLDEAKYLLQDHLMKKKETILEKAKPEFYESSEKALKKDSLFKRLGTNISQDLKEYGKRKRVDLSRTIGYLDVSPEKRQSYKAADLSDLRGRAEAYGISKKELSELESRRRGWEYIPEKGGGIKYLKDKSGQLTLINGQPVPLKKEVPEYERLSDSAFKRLLTKKIEKERETKSEVSDLKKIQKEEFKMRLADAKRKQAFSALNIARTGMELRSLDSIGIRQQSRWPYTRERPVPVGSLFDADIRQPRPSGEFLDYRSSGEPGYKPTFYIPKPSASYFDSDAPKFTYKRMTGEFTRKSSRMLADDKASIGQESKPSTKVSKSRAYPWTKPMKGWVRVYEGKGRSRGKGSAKKSQAGIKSFYSHKKPKKLGFQPYASTYELKGVSPSGKKLRYL